MNYFVLTIAFLAFAGPSLVFCQNIGSGGSSGGSVDSLNSTLVCGESSMTLYINRTLVESENFTLNNVSCVSSYNASHVEITAGYGDCGTVITETAGQIIFENEASNQDSVIPPGTLITRGVYHQYAMKCTFDRMYNSTLDGGFQPGASDVVIAQEEDGVFGIELSLFQSNAFTTPYTSYPVSFELKEDMFVGLVANATNSGVKMVPQACYATTTNNYHDTNRYYIIQNRCPGDTTFNLQSSDNEKFLFEIEAFKFSSSNGAVYLHCHVVLCAHNNTNQMCTFGCPPPTTPATTPAATTTGIPTVPVELERRRRALDGDESAQMMDKKPNVYTLSTKKIILLTNEEDLPRSVSQTNIYNFIGIAVMCVLLLAVIILGWKLFKRNEAANKADGNNVQA